MSRLRLHNFAISLDGFGTGEGLTREAPFGHAGERLHEWMFATRFWRTMAGEPGGSTGVDNAFAEQHGIGVTDLSVTVPSLETVFIDLTGSELRE